MAGSFRYRPRSRPISKRSDEIPLAGCASDEPRDGMALSGGPRPMIRHLYVVIGRMSSRSSVGPRGGGERHAGTERNAGTPQRHERQEGPGRARRCDVPLSSSGLRHDRLLHARRREGLTPGGRQFNRLNILCAAGGPADLTRAHWPGAAPRLRKAASMRRGVREDGRMRRRRSRLKRWTCPDLTKTSARRGRFSISSSRAS